MTKSRDLANLASTVPAGTTASASVVGYMGIPQNSTTTGSYTITAADNGKHIYCSATRTLTIDSNANLALPKGFTFTVIAVSGNSSNLINYITIATTGSVTSYGSLSVARWMVATSAKASSYLVVFGGYAISGGAKTSTIDQFLISSTGNATSWGTLTTAYANDSGNTAGGQNSNCHGGL